MRSIISLSFILLALVSTNANAWFFYIPGSTIDSVSDAISGAEGENCVGPNAKVGDIVSFPSGSSATIKSLSGTSSRCTRPELPIRALLEYSVSTSKIGIELTDEWKPKPLWSRQIISGGILLAENHASDSVSYLYISAIKRENAPDMKAYATNVRSEWAKSLPFLQQFKGGSYIANSQVAEESRQTEIEQITVNGMRAWRFEVTGKRKSEFSIEFTYLITILEGANEIVQVNAWTTAGTFQKQREAFKQLAVNVSGIESPSSPVVVAPTTEPTMTTPPKVPVVVAPSNLPVSATPSTPPLASPVVSTPSSNSLPNQSGNAASRLRELNQLYKDGVINKNDFEEKKKEILKSM